MKKILFVSHTANFAKFNIPFMRWFHQQGWIVHYASDGKESVCECDRNIQISFERNPMSLKNIKAYKELKNVIEKENYNIIHCHTPVGGVVTRLAAKRSRKRGTAVLYTAHGFHFYKGASILNWFLYFSIEKMLSGITDCLITINNEDYLNAVSHKFKTAVIEKIDGVGVDLQRFSIIHDSKSQLRKEYGLKDNQYIIICVAEINHNKDQKFLLENMVYLKNQIPEIKALIVGEGPERQQCEAMVEKSGLKNQVEFLGYRKDVNKLLAVADVLVSSSRREGLPVNVIEGMACGLPIICTNIRGQRDLITDGQNGYLYEVADRNKFCNLLIYLHNNPEKILQISRNNIEKVQKFSLNKAIIRMESIYRRYMGSGE